jgi:Icc-related predicted phosphoesterase
MRVVGISDTHNQTPDLPPGDLLIHSGDLTVHGFRIEVMRQLCWLEEQRHKFKWGVIVPGNHDLHIEKHLEETKQACAEIGYVLLHNESYVLENGVKIYGSAHTPNYHNWAFMLDQCEIQNAWELIPLDTRILITHGPPKGILDLSYRGEHIGCWDLANKVREVKPVLHQFGHAHEGAGEIVIDGIHYMNAARNVRVVDLEFK